MEATKQILGCEKFGTSVMKEDEVILFVEAAVENGSNIPEAYQDMKMIDTLLHMKKLHFATRSTLKYTASGNLRKDRGLSNALMSVIDGRVANAF